MKGETPSTYKGGSTLRRGDIYMADFGEGNIRGSEQKGDRPVIIIQNDMGNIHSDTVIVACITTQKKSGLPVHMKIDVYEPSTILLEQIKTVCKSRLVEYICTIEEDRIGELNSKIMVSLGL